MDTLASVPAINMFPVLVLMLYVTGEQYCAVKYIDSYIVLRIFDIKPKFFDFIL